MDGKHKRRWRIPWLVVGELWAMAFAALWLMMFDDQDFDGFLEALLMPAIIGAVVGLAIESYIDLKQAK